MTNIESTKDTISKLLALSASPNENEARAALLKARKLMAKYKLREADIKGLDTMEVVERLTEITCTKLTNTWASCLASTIANNYCCRSYYSHVKKAKKITVGLVGLEDDIDICERIVNYAFDTVIAQCKLIRKQYRNIYPAKLIRQMENAYGHGFCEGLQKAYQEQDTEHQEYGLVLVTPQAVTDHMAKMKEGGAYGAANYEGWRLEFARRGYQDGKQFEPSTKLPENTMP